MAASGAEGAAERGVRIAEQVDDAAGFDDVTVVEPRDGIRHLQHRIHLVGDEEDGEAEVAAQLTEERDDRRRRFGVEAGGRLVGEQDGRAQREGSGDAHPLPLSAGELVREVVGTIGEAHPLEQLADPARGLRGRHAEVLEREGDVLSRRAPGEETVGLEDRTDSPASDPQLPLAEPGQVLSPDVHRTGGRTLEQVDALREGALPSAAGTHDGEDLAGLDAEVEAVEDEGRRLAVAVDLGELFDADHAPQPTSGWRAAHSGGATVCRHMSPHDAMPRSTEAWRRGMKCPSPPTRCHNESNRRRCAGRRKSP